MKRRVCLCGGIKNGEVMTILHGNEIRIAGTGDVYKRPDNPKIMNNIEFWPLVQIDQ